MARRFIFERKHQPLLSYSDFVKRMIRCSLWALSLLVGTLCLGSSGFHWIEKQLWVDAFLNAVFIMTGLGLIGELRTIDGKIFTIVFSLLSPVVFYSILTILFTPLLHRFLHSFHLDK
jgi:hypothetical protein